MKIIGNIGTGFKLWRTITKYNKEIPKVEKLKELGKHKEAQELIASDVSSWVNTCIKELRMNFHIEGKENIPDGPCVFIGNHQGYVDIIALMKATEGKQVSFIAKEELKKTPYISKWVTVTGGLFITRGNPRSALKTLNEGAELLKKGYSLVIFPEGKRSNSSEMNPFQQGSFKLATKAKVPIVPFSLDRTYKTFEETGIYTYDVNMYVKIHKPIETKDLSKKEQNELHTKVENIVREGLDELIKKSQ